MRNKKCTISFFLQIVLFSLLSGCATTYFQRNTANEDQLLKKDIGKITAVELKNLTDIEPIGIDEASKRYVEEVLKTAEMQKVVPMELAEVRSAALTNNLELKVQLMSPSIASEKVNEEKAKFEAVFGGGINHTETNTPTSSKLQGSTSNSTNYELGVHQPLITGGKMDITLPFSDFKTNNAWSTLNPAYESDLKFSLSQPLLKNAGLRTNTHTIRVSEFEKKIEDAKTKLEAIRILASADKAYWLVYGASQELGVRQQQYKLAERQLNEARLRVKSEAAPKVEITRAESGMAARLEGIIQAATQLRLAERNLRFIMNRPDLPLDSYQGLIPSTDPNPVGLQLESKKLIQYALDNRMEMLETELQLAMDQSTIDFAKNQKLPLITLDYSYNINGLGNSYGHSFDQLSRVDFPDWQVGMQAQIPIGNKAANARLQQAILMRAQRLATKEQRKQAIEHEVLNALDQLNENWQRILAARQEVIYAGRTFEAERRQFELGVRTSTEVLDAAARLADAQLREVRALLDYQVTQVDIAYATGTLLGEAQVEWDVKKAN